METLNRLFFYTHAGTLSPPLNKNEIQAEYQKNWTEIFDHGPFVSIDGCTPSTVHAMCSFNQIGMLRELTEVVEQ